MKKIIGYLLCLFLLFAGWSMSMDYVVANETDEVEYNGYSQPLDQNVIGVYLQQNDEEALLMYCFSNGEIAPPTLNDAIDLPSYHQIDYTDEKGYGALLYVGYPNDYIGLMQKYGLDDGEAYKETQAALWTLQNADLNVYLQYNEPFPSYYLELLHYVAENVNNEIGEYELTYFVSDDNSYQSLITLQCKTEVDEIDSSNDNNENIGEENVKEDVLEQDNDKTITTLQFWLFISFALLAILIAIIWCCLKMRKRCR